MPQPPYGEYTYALVHPGTDREAQSTNRRLFAHGPVYGLNITDPALVDRCVWNLGSDGNAPTAAIEAAIVDNLPQRGATIVTLRQPDADGYAGLAEVDGVAGMGVLAMRANGTMSSAPEVQERVAEFTPGAEAPRVWRPGMDIEPVSAVEALRIVVADTRRDIARGVGRVQSWIATGSRDGLKDAITRVRFDRFEQLAVDRKVELLADERIAVVESTSRFARLVASWHAPVVLTVDPEYAFPDGSVGPKVTIRQPDEGGYAKLGGVRRKLARIEEGWGGSNTSISSSSRRPTELELERIETILIDHLI